MTLWIMIRPSPPTGGSWEVQGRAGGLAAGLKGGALSRSSMVSSPEEVRILASISPEGSLRYPCWMMFSQASVTASWQA